MRTASKQLNENRTIPQKSVSKSEPTITCPKCGHIIKLTESLVRPLFEQTRREYKGRIAEMNADVAKHEKEFQGREKEIEKEKARIKQQVADQIEEERVKMTAEETKKNAAIAKREKALRDRETEVAKALSSADDQVAEKLRLERSRIIVEEANKAKRDDDRILYQPPKGKGSRLKIRYQLPR